MCNNKYAYIKICCKLPHFLNKKDKVFFNLKMSNVIIQNNKILK